MLTAAAIAPLPRRRSDLIDFASGAPSPAYAPTHRLSGGGVHLSRGRLAANAGAAIGAAQLVAVIVESAPFDVEWRPPGERRLRRDLLLPNSALIAPAGRCLFARWSAEPVVLAVAFESKLVDALRDETGARPDRRVCPHLGLHDPDIDAAASKFRLELRLGGAAGPLYLQSLGIVLAVHLLQNYGADQKPPPRGGLGSRRLKRVVDYAECRLGDPITLSDLAGVAGLSPHHFAGAFRASTGITPHRYLMERRLARACDLLADNDAPVTMIAHGLGFASHGHFTATFRRLIGVTPSQYRAGKR